MKTWTNIAAATFTCVTLAGCAGTQTQDGNPQDPWEGFNRGVYSFNDTLDRYALKPVAQGYDYITPTLVQEGVAVLDAPGGPEPLGVEVWLDGDSCGGCGA